MPIIPSSNKSPRGLVRRALDRARVAERSADLAQRVFARSAPLATVALDRLGEAVDAMSSRALATDDGASQLAFLVETIAAEHPREEVLAAVLQHNLLLDGTFLSIMRPALAGGDALDLSPATLERARLTVLTLIEALVALREPEADRADASQDPLSDRLTRLADRADDLPLDALLPILAGERPDDEVAHFIVRSYSLFLQTFLLRSTVRLAPDVLGGRLLGPSDDP